MDLTLTIIEAPQSVNMINHTKAFPAAGGSLGRADSNFWVLPDYERVVSSRHADISQQSGRFYLTDRSTNGTFHNHSEQPVGQDQSIPLNHGDILSVGDYRLKVSIKRPEKSPQLPKGLQPADFLDSSDKTLFTSTTPAEHEQRNQLKDLDDWLEPGMRTSPPTHSAVWGTAGAQATARPVAVDLPATSQGNDPLTALGALSDSPTPSSCIDPLAALDHAAAITPPSAPVWEDDDDWWKAGSDSDHASVLTQAMHTPAAIPHPTYEAVPHLIADPVPSSIWDNQPHLHNVAVTDVDEALGFVPAAAMTPPTPVSSVAPCVPSQMPLQPPLLQHSHSQAQQLQSPQLQSPQLQSPALPSQAHAQTGSMFADPGQLAPQPPGSSSAQHITGELAAALGLDGLAPQQQALLIPEVAAIVHEAVNRLIDLLRARSSIKNELRVQRTIIQMLDNNPLKFSVSAQDAIKNMFNSDNPAFMRPGDAVRASFDDLSDHQVAVLAGMRSGYDSMLKHFDPANLDKRFNNASSLLSNKKAKNWEAFERYYALLKQDGEASYDLLFGDNFATTYEQQLAELKTARNLTRPGS